MNPVAPKLELPLPEVTGWGLDAAICATGTTIKKVGLREAFRSVDLDVPLSFARLAECLVECTNIGALQIFNELDFAALSIREIPHDCGDRALAR